mmetsp:Transcript_4282/g.6842  ORF Transcript_4282/g.6842 Transcript_4282/m.6842 type:complete len:200 (-) Transcript_4282:466-1065(-)
MSLTPLGEAACSRGCNCCPCLHYSSNSGGSRSDEVWNRLGARANYVAGLPTKINHVFANLEGFVLERAQQPVLTDAVLSEVPLVLSHLSPGSDRVVQLNTGLVAFQSGRSCSRKLLIVSVLRLVHLEHLFKDLNRGIYPQKGVADIRVGLCCTSSSSCLAALHHDCNFLLDSLGGPSNHVPCRRRRSGLWSQLQASSTI